ncbi:MAG: hypothetical protein ACYS7Y_29120 [Planctomycetota bacterium]|jgi:hypothetical protein
MDNMPYKSVDDFYYTELDEFDTLVLPHVPGVQRPLYELQRAEVVREFCRRTGALIGQHPAIEVYKDVFTYDVQGIPELLDVLTIKQIRYEENGRPLPEKAYLLDQDRSTFTLQSSWDTSLEGKKIIPVISLTVGRASVRIPTDFFERWGDFIAYGIAATLMMIPRKQWTNPEAAALYMGKYDSGIANAKIAVSRGFDKYAVRTVKASVFE